MSRRIALLVSVDLAWALELAHSWVAAGDTVTLLLLDGAVASARSGHRSAPGLRAAQDAGVTVAAEERAAARRALGPQDLIDGVKVVDLDEVADLVADGADTVRWL
jgi:intracellular sulfur oxidation DsrE/DsrF family protein